MPSAVEHSRPPSTHHVLRFGIHGQDHAILLLSQKPPVRPGMSSLSSRLGAMLRSMARPLHHMSDARSSLPRETPDWGPWFWPDVHRSCSRQPCRPLTGRRAVARENSTDRLVDWLSNRVWHSAVTTGVPLPNGQQMTASQQFLSLSVNDFGPPPYAVAGSSPPKSVRMMPD